jgi:hypothetical protein
MKLVADGGIELSEEGPEKPEVVAMTVGREIGEQDIPHLQGFVTFIGDVTRVALEEILGGRAHLEVMRGSVRQNQIYCRKQGDLLYGGTNLGRSADELQTGLIIMNLPEYLWIRRHSSRGQPPPPILIWLLGSGPVTPAEQTLQEMRPLTIPFPR